MTCIDTNPTFTTRLQYVLAQIPLVITSGFWELCILKKLPIRLESVIMRTADIKPTFTTRLQYVLAKRPQTLSGKNGIGLKRLPMEKRLYDKGQNTLRPCDRLRHRFLTDVIY